MFHLRVHELLFSFFLTVFSCLHLNITWKLNVFGFIHLFTCCNGLKQVLEKECIKWLSDPFVFSQEYILKGVVNAALGQEIGSVSICVKLEELHVNGCDHENRECETNMHFCLFTEGSLENRTAILSAGWRLGERMRYSESQFNQCDLFTETQCKHVKKMFCPFRHYSWQTVHGLLLLPLAAVWRCSHLSKLSQGWCCIELLLYCGISV